MELVSAFDASLRPTLLDIGLGLSCCQKLCLGPGKLTPPFLRPEVIANYKNTLIVRLDKVS